MNKLLEQLRDRLRTMTANAEAWFTGLSQRERTMVGAAGGTAVLMVLFIVFFTLGNTAASTRKRTATKLLKLEQAQALAANYQEAEQERQNAESQLRSSNVSLITFVEEKGTAAHLDILAMTPKGDVPLGDGRILQNSADMDLADVELGRLTELLQSVERGPGVVKVTSLRLEPHPTTKNLTANATFSTYHLKEGAQ